MSDPTPTTSGSDTPEAKKQAIVFFDAQNLYFSAQEAFRVREPNFDPVMLAQHICGERGWELKQVRFYTGVPGASEQPRWHRYWTAKLRRLRNQKVAVFDPQLRYRRKEAELPITPEAARWVRLLLPDGSQLPRGPITVLTREGREVPPGTVLSIQVGEEKGVDVRFAIDFIRATIDRAFDVAVLFTQDQDHAEAVREAKEIAKSQNRQIELFSVYPEGCQNTRGVNGTTWVQITKAVYDACIDPRNYFGS